MPQASRKPVELKRPRLKLLANTMRQSAAQQLPKGNQRPTFWDRITQKAFGPAPKQGCVTLVGAGPGDAELLTLKAVRALQSADVILFDDLVSDEVLDLARREARRMLVGKRGGRDSCRQEDINALMIKLALQGKHVVRLKSGDPMIFGRAGEEIAELHDQGISVAVVPGISAGIALAAELGVSLTHRDHAHSVRFVTGHARSGKLPEDLDWKGIADPETTVMFYMGGRTAPAIAARLLSEGLPAETPVVIAKAIGRPQFQLARTTLAGLVGETSLLAEGEPVLLGIGNVFANRGVRANSRPDSGMQKAANS